jgi:hypothetical protein
MEMQWELELICSIFPDSDVYIISATNLGTFLDTDLTELYNEDFQDELLDIVFKKHEHTIE